MVFILTDFTLSGVVSTFEVGWTISVLLAEYIYEIFPLRTSYLESSSKMFILIYSNNSSKETKNAACLNVL